MTDPNTFDQELKDANANPEATNQGTEEKDTPNPAPDAEPAVDYQKKFSESSKEALRLLEEKKKLQEERDRLARELAEKGSQDTSPDKITESLYPGFEDLDHNAQENLIKFTESVTRRAQAEILRDPAIAFARQTYNEKKWDSAFDSISSKYPELKESREEFKAKYYKASNVPDNIENILEDVSKIYLFDKAKAIGAREQQEKEKRIELERTNGGDKAPQASRSLQDWQRMAQENPAKFASLSKEYKADLDSGKLRE